MATRSSGMIEYAFATRTTALAAATRHDFTAITVALPENSSRSFKSVMVEITFRDDSDTAQTATSLLAGIKIDSVAFSDTTKTETLTNTGEHQAMCITLDATSYFNTNYTSTSHSVQVGFQAGGMATINITAKLYIQYEYSDTSQTTIAKTIRIPLDSGLADLTTTLTEIGTNQVPQLDGSGGWRENEAVVADDCIWFEIEGNESASGTGNFNLAVALDSESEVQDGTHRQALASAVYYRFVWVRTSDFPSKSAVHAFKMRTVTNARMNHPRITLCVTYRVTVASMTKAIQSLVLPFNINEGPCGGTTSSDQDVTRVSFFIPEANPALLQSGVAVFYSYSALGVTIGTVNLAVGGQTHRGYTMTATPANGCGQWSTQQRFDSGGAAGSGFTIASGWNDIDIKLYGDNASMNRRPTGVSGFIILNYRSDIASGGVWTHNQTGLHLIQAHTTTAQDLITAASAPSIPEANYWLNHVGYRVISYLDSSRECVHAAAERKTGEGPADGWVDLLSLQAGTSSEFSWLDSFCNASREFKRFPAEFDPNYAMDIETARTYRLPNGDTAISSFNLKQLVMLYTKHAITTTISGTVSGYTGDGSGLTVEIHRNTGNKEKLAEATTSAGGGYSATVYDAVSSKFAHVRQDSTHVGRADNFTTG